MALNRKQIKIIKWVARIMAIAIIAFGIPFYFGYGNPLPFINPEYSLYDNVWLTIFPLMFIGLALGWKYEKLGGYLVTIPIAAGITFSLTTIRGFGIHMIVPLIVGILYLITGYNKKQ
ncbi:MAG: hypothetical protein FXF54_04795 [Kosmotoga sp.]|nr:MAG: hypothetical protein FXF54_04795 [Kosmotoga sp.]